MALAEIRRQEVAQNGIEVKVGPDNRAAYLDAQLALDGLTGVATEDPNAAYCALSLTSVPKADKNIVAGRQKLMMRILKAAGIDSYDPGTAKYSPDQGLDAPPEEVYRYDLARVAGARYFTAFDIFPSNGVGAEMQAARQYNRIPVIIHDPAIRTSRMQPNRSIHLQTDNFYNRAEELVQIFRMLREYEPGMGLTGDVPVLLGFKGGSAVDLPQLVYDQFPHLQYKYEPSTPIAELTTANRNIFFETNEWAQKRKTS